VRDPDELTEGDWRFLLGFGPLGNLSPGETLPLTIAVVNGVNVADLIAHAKLAKGIPVLSPAQDLTDQGPVFLSLGGGVPNPFRDHVTLSVHLSAPGELEAGIYDLQGRLVQALLRDSRPAGHHSLVWHSGCADPGVYVCRVTAGGERPSRRVVLAR
jgi:hypothetical protein